MYPLLNHFESWTFSVIQCHIRICFQTCLNKRVADEFFCRRNAGQAHWIYARNFDVLHSFDITYNADNVETWPTSIMWQGTSTSDLSSEKDFDLISAIDLRIWKGRRFENTLKSDRNLRWWCQWTPIWNWTSIWVYHIYLIKPTWFFIFSICSSNICWVSLSFLWREFLSSSSSFMAFFISSSLTAKQYTEIISLPR